MKLIDEMIRLTVVITLKNRLFDQIHTLFVTANPRKCSVKFGHMTHSILIHLDKQLTLLCSSRDVALAL